MKSLDFAKLKKPVHPDAWTNNMYKYIGCLGLIINIDKEMDDVTFLLNDNIVIHVSQKELEVV